MDTSLWAGRWRSLLLVVITALALLWPALLNGGPFWFPDTSNYMRGADAAVVTVTGSRSKWSDQLEYRPDSLSPAPGAADAASTGDGARANAESGGWVSSRPVISGRSVYYGMVLYLPMRALGPWGGVIVQALMVAALVVGSLMVATRALRADTRIVVPASMAFLTLLTPLPHYTSMLMPDVYSGVLILVLATVILFWEQLGVARRLLFVGAAALMVTFHTTHVLIAVAVTGAAMLFFFRGKARLRPLLVALPLIVVAIAGEAAFSHVTQLQLGVKPLSPPFLSARLTASGPGTDYLHRNCDGSADDFALCAHRDRLPLFSDDFLWAEDEERGLFQLVDAQEQRRIAQQDKAFFLAVTAGDPVAAFAASAEALGQQLVAFDLGNFNYNAVLLEMAPRQLPAAEEEQFFRSRAANGTMPVAFTVSATVVTSLAALLLLAIALGRSLARRELPLAPAYRYALLIVLGILANAMICGAFSKPGARYQMRLIWLLPVAAAVVLPHGRQLQRLHDDSLGR